jgi:hypothetical protein
MNWLEKGYEEQFNHGVLLRPAFDLLRSDPRFPKPSAPHWSSEVTSVSKNFRSISATASTDRGLKVMKPSKAMALIFRIAAVRAGGGSD